MVLKKASAAFLTSSLVAALLACLFEHDCKSHWWVGR